MQSTGTENDNIIIHTQSLKEKSLFVSERLLRRSCEQCI